jgi:uncharacterized protein with HEPN domain
MSDRSPKLLIEDIIESGNKILQYTRDITFEQFLLDDKTKDAVIRNFEIIGEAANRLPGQFKKDNQQIDWLRIRGFRNRIVHDYFGIDFQIVWNILSDFLPVMIEDLKKLIR